MNKEMTGIHEAVRAALDASGYKHIETSGLHYWTNYFDVYLTDKRRNGPYIGVQGRHLYLFLEDPQHTDEKRGPFRHVRWQVRMVSALILLVTQHAKSTHKPSAPKPPSNLEARIAALEERAAQDDYIKSLTPDDYARMKEPAPAEFSSKYQMDVIKGVAPPDSVIDHVLAKYQHDQLKDAVRQVLIMRFGASIYIPSIVLDIHTQYSALVDENATLKRKLAESERVSEARANKFDEAQAEVSRLQNKLSGRETVKADVKVGETNVRGHLL
jgi:hypothetical protein